MKVYGYMKCDTCRKALKRLDAAGVDFKPAVYAEVWG